MKLRCEKHRVKIQHLLQVPGIQYKKIDIHAQSQVHTGDGSNFDRKHKLKGEQCIQQQHQQQK